MKTSIIVPVYNAEQTIRRCLDSIKKQTVCDFECIIIDDGSSDSSPQICDSYAMEDSRFFVFHKKNGGVSAARNFGINHAKGDWICFVDSDDFVSEDYLDEISKQFSNSDSVFWGYKVGDKSIVPHQIFGTIDDAIGAMKKNLSFLRPVWNTAFKRTLLESNRIQFVENMHLGEDYLFVLNYLICCPTKSSVVSKPVYNYCIDNSVLSHKHYSISVLLEWQKELIKNVKQLQINKKNKSLLFYDRYKSIMNDIYLAPKLDRFDARWNLLKFMKQEKIIIYAPLAFVEIKGLMMHLAKRIKMVLKSLLWYEYD